MNSEIILAMENKVFEWLNNTGFRDASVYKNYQNQGQKKFKMILTGKFLATLVALHFTPVSKSLGHSFGLA